MKTLAALTTVLVLSLPSLALACESFRQQAQMSCVEGTVYDNATRTCVRLTG